ncbi:MAG: serine protease [Bacteroidota bacterium]
MKIYRIILFILLGFSIHQGMSQQVLLEKGQKVAELWCFPLMEDPVSFVYLPGKIAVAIDEEGNPIFSLLQYIQEQATEPVDTLSQEGAFLNLQVEYSSSQEQLNNTETTLKQLYGEDARLEGPVIFRDIRYSLMVTDVNGGVSEESIILASGRASTINENQAFLSFGLSPENAQILIESLTTPLLEVDIVFDMGFSGYSDPHKALIEVDWDKLEEGGLFSLGDEAQTQEEVDLALTGLWAEGAIQLHQDHQTYSDRTYQNKELASLIFSANRRLERWLFQSSSSTIFSGKIRKRLNGSLDEENKVLRDYSFSQLFLPNNINRKGNSTFSINGRTKLEKYQTLSLSLKEYFVDYARTFEKTNLNDPLFTQRKVMIGFDPAIYKAFQEGDMLNFITISLRKQHESGEITLEEILIDKKNIQKAFKSFAFRYGLRNDQDKLKWLSYEYRVRWMFAGGGTFDTDWIESQVPMINLVAPFRPHSIAFEGDLEQLSDLGVKLMVATLSYPFFGKEREVRRTIRPVDELASKSVEILLPNEVKFVNYQLDWVDKQGKRYKKKGKDELGFIFLDNLPEEFPGTTSQVRGFSSLGKDISYESLRNPVVHIQSGYETGTGFIVGKDDNSIYLCTAAHVLENADDISISFYDGTSQSASVMKVHETFDLAVIKCPIAQDQKVQTFSGNKTQFLSPNQEVIIVGHPLGNKWDVNFLSKVKELEFDLQEDLFTLSPQGIAPGSSGSPVLNKDHELLGLIIETDQIKAVCVKKAFLLKACRAWNVPINLFK